MYLKCWAVPSLFVLESFFLIKSLSYYLEWTLNYISIWSNHHSSIKSIGIAKEEQQQQPFFIVGSKSPDANDEVHLSPTPTCQ